MKVLIAGGRGFIGSALVRRLTEAGHECTIVCREPQSPREIAYRDLGDFREPHDAVINLAGESVAARWTMLRKARIRLSRIAATRTLVAWMEGIEPKPQVFLSASAAGIYGHRPGETLTEDSELDPSLGFRARVCIDWEEAALPAEELGIRTVRMRIGNVLDPSGGYLMALLGKFRVLPLFVLGRPSSHVPWISLEDACHLIIWCLAADVLGAVNLTAPGASTQREMAELVGRLLSKPVVGAVPAWALRLGLGEMARALTDDQVVVPSVALDCGYTFRHKTLVEFEASLSA